MSIPTIIRWRWFLAFRTLLMKRRPIFLAYHTDTNILPVRRSPASVRRVPFQTSSARSRKRRASARWPQTPKGRSHSAFSRLITAQTERDESEQKAEVFKSFWRAVLMTQRWWHGARSKEDVHFTRALPTKRERNPLRTHSYTRWRALHRQSWVFIVQRYNMIESSGKDFCLFVLLKRNVSAQLPYNNDELNDASLHQRCGGEGACGAQ